MKRPSPEIYDNIAKMARNFPQVVDWLGEWRMAELTQLPLRLENTAYAQGRAAVLGELYELIKKASE